MEQTLQKFEATLDLSQNSNQKMNRSLIVDENSYERAQP